jgi:hypothetical protein
MKLGSGGGPLQKPEAWGMAASLPWPKLPASVGVPFIGGCVSWLVPLASHRGCRSIGCEGLGGGRKLLTEIDPKLSADLEEKSQMICGLFAKRKSKIRLGS